MLLYCYLFAEFTTTNSKSNPIKLVGELSNKLKKRIEFVECNSDFNTYMTYQYKILSIADIIDLYNLDIVLDNNVRLSAVIQNFSSVGEAPLPANKEYYSFEFDYSRSKPLSAVIKQFVTDLEYISYLAETYV